MFMGFAIASFSLSYLLVTALDSNEGSAASGCLIFAMYLLMLLILTILLFPRIMYPRSDIIYSQFGMKMSGVPINQPGVPAAQQHPANGTVNQSAIPDELLTTEQVHRTFPSLLVFTYELLYIAPCCTNCLQGR